MTWVLNAAATVLVLILLWPVCSVIGWLSVRPGLGALRHHYPWSWRLLLGPWAYFRWLDRRHR